MTTTIYQASTDQAYISRSSFTAPTPITPTSLFDSNGVAETGGFVLYLPLSSIPGGRKLVNIALATQAISFGPETTTGSSLKLFAAESSSALTALNDRQSSYLFTAQETLFIPVTAHLPQQVTVSNLQQSLESILLPKDPDSQIQATALPTVYTPSQSDLTATRTSDAVASSTMAASTVNTAAYKSTLIGSVIGALLVGVALGIALITCLSMARRRWNKDRDRSSRIMPHKRISTETDDEANDLPMTKYEADWWNDLPLDTSEEDLRNGFVQLFNSIDHHIADYYRSYGNAAVLTKIAMQLDTFTYDDRFGQFDEERIVLPLLQRMLASFIVARISLRSNVMDSFLPLDFTNIPKQKGWQMENSSSSSAPDTLHTAFLRVFSGWRVLSASLFNHEEHRSSRELDARVERAAREFMSASSEFVKTSVNDRQRKSLEHIMKEACTIGVKTFARRSTIIFEWSELAIPSDRRTIIVFPAIVKMLDEKGQGFPGRKVLLPATTARM